MLFGISRIMCVLGYSWNTAPSCERTLKQNSAIRLNASMLQRYYITTESEKIVDVTYCTIYATPCKQPKTAVSSSSNYCRIQDVSKKNSIHSHQCMHTPKKNNKMLQQTPHCVFRFSKRSTPTGRL